MQTKNTLIKKNCLCGKIRGESGVETFKIYANYIYSTELFWLALRY